ncbi:mitochondrial protein Pet127-domain-containing protein [Lineolata rhizophorae]|uniref:Mitochondrial protein Pet127-domain-containing protein n=1 Tax=Lineolata rhizophorae TaxID=578093 RepID=A0A6A6NZN1_9PEZI|nr:mitochondrial protein Pet127-domain-containing protein [Lineolata rhizophorae]
MLLRARRLGLRARPLPLRGPSVALQLPYGSFFRKWLRSAQTKPTSTHNGEDLESSEQPGENHDDSSQGLFWDPQAGEEVRSRSSNESHESTGLSRYPSSQYTRKPRRITQREHKPLKRLNRLGAQFLAPSTLLEDSRKEYQGERKPVERLTRGGPSGESRATFRFVQSTPDHEEPFRFANFDQRHEELPGFEFKEDDDSLNQSGQASSGITRHHGRKPFEDANPKQGKAKRPDSKAGKSNKKDSKVVRKSKKGISRNQIPGRKGRQSVAVKGKKTASKASSTKHKKSGRKDTTETYIPPGTPGQSRIAKRSEVIHRVAARNLELIPLPIHTQEVPQLSYSLDRVLFNPGVYYLQDPRSHVYNFDPYLETLMPVNEFNFESIRDFVESSRDVSLTDVAQKFRKKYVGSTSSTTGALTHFHFLISQWRRLNFSMLSRSFKETSDNFTEFYRMATPLFLRYKPDTCTYAMDADKEFDTANVLSRLGQSIEKLLTLPKDEFERYRRSNESPLPETRPEAYHYSTIGDFVLRSQLDAHDPRLPGAGMFDLKSRAVVAVRMAVQRSEMTGYQIRYGQGEWESYEREQYDMARSTLLKYSLQARIGRMDGIFLAYHNVERIFGFQYMSLSEMDRVLHDQSDRALGDQEFLLSATLLNRVLDRATEKYPGTTIRFHFETREGDAPFMYVFAEPMSDERAAAIQNSNKEKVKAMERAMLGLDTESESVLDSEAREEWRDLNERVQEELNVDEQNDEDAAAAAAAEGDEEEDEDEDESEALDDDEDKEENEDVEEANEQGDEGEEDEELDQADEEDEGSSISEESEAEDIGEEVTDSENERGIADETEASSEASEYGTESNANGMGPDIAAENTEREQTDRDLLVMILTVRNKVNNEYVTRPNNLSASDFWELEYSIQEVTDPDRAWALYNRTRERRRKRHESIEDKTNLTKIDYFRRILWEFSQSGREWRKEEDERQRKMGPKVVYKERHSHGHGHHHGSRAGRNDKQVHGAAAEGGEVATDDVGDYMNWLYRGGDKE